MPIRCRMGMVHSTGGKYLSGIHQSLRIEDPTDPIHHLEVVTREDVTNVLALFQADAVFAGHRSARVGAELQDLVADAEHGFVLAGLERIEEDQRMEVSVARVEPVAE